eukprot:165315_1
MVLKIISFVWSHMMKLDYLRTFPCNSQIYPIGQKCSIAMYIFNAILGGFPTSNTILPRTTHYLANEVGGNERNGCVLSLFAVLWTRFKPVMKQGQLLSFAKITSFGSDKAIWNSKQDVIFFLEGYLCVRKFWK